MSTMVYYDELIWAEKDMYMHYMYRRTIGNCMYITMHLVFVRDQLHEIAMSSLYMYPLIHCTCYSNVIINSKY